MVRAGVMSPITRVVVVPVVGRDGRSRRVGVPVVLHHARVRVAVLLWAARVRGAPSVGGRLALLRLFLEGGLDRRGAVEAGSDRQVGRADVAPHAGRAAPLPGKLLVGGSRVAHGAAAYYGELQRARGGGGAVPHQLGAVLVGIGGRPPQAVGEEGGHEGHGPSARGGRLGELEECIEVVVQINVPFSRVQRARDGARGPVRRGHVKILPPDRGARGPAQPRGGQSWGGEHLAEVDAHWRFRGRLHDRIPLFLPRPLGGQRADADHAALAFCYLGGVHSRVPTVLQLREEVGGVVTIDG
mmetsp:Transcript_32255/g.68705  ORF Transcript_32255/g.68705 Transcript_32255/m.68705 type:complete len:299 (+) Transcript_32255:153-1049(+)